MRATDKYSDRIGGELDRKRDQERAEARELLRKAGRLMGELDHIDFENLRSGAMPDESIQMMSDGYDTLHEGQAAKIAEQILSESEGEKWDKVHGTGRTRVPNRHLDGYGRKESVTYGHGQPPHPHDASALVGGQCRGADRHRERAMDGAQEGCRRGAHA
jgi:hypothetical protein